VKIHIENTSLTLDIDPEDLSDEMLKACLAVAEARGLSAEGAEPRPDPTAELRTAIKRTYASLLRGNIGMAVAQLAFIIGQEGSGKMINDAIRQSYGAAFAADPANDANGSRRPVRAPHHLDSWCTS